MIVVYYALSSVDVATVLAFSASLMGDFAGMP